MLKTNKKTKSFHIISVELSGKVFFLKGNNLFPGNFRLRIESKLVKMSKLHMLFLSHSKRQKMPKKVILDHMPVMILSGRDCRLKMEPPTPNIKLKIKTWCVLGQSIVCTVSFYMAGVKMTSICQSKQMFQKQISKHRGRKPHQKHTTLSSVVKVTMNASLSDSRDTSVFVAIFPFNKNIFLLQTPSFSVHRKLTKLLVFPLWN